MDFRSKTFRFGFIGGLIAAGLLPGARAEAQTPPAAPAVPGPAAPAADPAQEAAKRAFESLPDADRIAMQDGLIWTGDYKGVADGKFGKGTRDAITAFAARNKLPADGTLDAKGRAALATMAKQAKDAAKFTVQPDDKTGLRIGLPLKLLTKVKPLPAGTRYSSADESFFVETSTRPGATLDELYAAAIADLPGRKITYKVSRPDFFVVTGDTGANTFYMRMARGQRAGIPTLNGFTVTYPIAAKARLESIVIAIANSFAPFPDAASVAATQAPAATSAPGAVATANAVPNPNDSSAAKPILTASGIIVAPGLVLTSLPKTCVDPQIRTKKAKIMKHTDADGLTLLSFPDASAAAVSLRTNDPAGLAPGVVLSFVSKLGGGEELIGAAGDIHKAEATGAWRLMAPVQSPVSGAAVLDRSGALAGVVPVDMSPVKLVAGVAPQMNRDVIPASKLAAFLAETKLKTAQRTDNQTTGEIVAAGSAAMLPISCVR